MKKVALISTIASIVAFGGGDLPPSKMPSADFWGQIGFTYQFQDENYKSPGDFTDKENNAFSTSIVLGVEKSLQGGLGFGAELAGWSDFGLNIADNSRVESGGDSTLAEVSQAYLIYSFGNTAIKAGRQALPKAVSPWVWSDRTAGVIDWSYDAITVANTDLENNTIIGAWVPHLYHHQSEEAHSSKSAGAFMLALINKSLESTTIALNGYYIPESKLNNFQALRNSLISSQKDTWSLWGNFLSEYDNITYGAQLAYVDGDESSWDSTFGISAKVASSWGDLSAELIAGYINDGDYSLSAGGGGTGVEDSGFWTDMYDVRGDTYGADQYSIQTRLNYKIPVGVIYGVLGYWDFDNHKKWGDEKSAWAGYIGYKFTFKGIDSKVEYRYRNFEYYSSSDKKRQRVRIEAYYKF